MENRIEEEYPIWGIADPDNQFFNGFYMPFILIENVDKHEKYSDEEGCDVFENFSDAKKRYLQMLTRCIKSHLNGEDESEEVCLFLVARAKKWKKHITAMNKKDYMVRMAK